MAYSGPLFFLTGFLNFASASREGSDEPANAQPRWAVTDRHCAISTNILCAVVYLRYLLFIEQKTVQMLKVKKKTLYKLRTSRWEYVFYSMRFRAPHTKH